MMSQSDQPEKSHGNVAADPVGAVTENRATPIGIDPAPGSSSIALSIETDSESETLAELLASQEPLLAELTSLIGTGEALAMVGAGSSITAGYTSWPRAIEELQEIAQKLNPPYLPDATSVTPTNYLGRAQELKDHIRQYGAGGQQAYFDSLGRVFRRSDSLVAQSLKDFHLQLVSLPFRGFLTTNYDPVLEYALAQVCAGHGRPRGVAIRNGDQSLVGPAIRSLAAGGAIEYVIHLHGVIEIGHSVILCADEYDEAYGLEISASLGARTQGAPLWSSHSPPHLLLLVSGLLATRRVVFVGFSFDDVYVTEVLRRVSNMLWEWNGATHFALMPVTRSQVSGARLRADKLKAECGIETIFYEQRGDDHGDRDVLINRIYAALAKKGKLRSGCLLERTGARSTREAVGDERATPASSWDLGWVTANNSAARARIDRRVR